MTKQNNNTKKMVEHILAGNYLEADKLLKIIVLESEDVREAKIAEDNGFVDESDNKTLNASNNGSDVDDTSDISKDDPKEDIIANDDLDKVSNDMTEIKCEVNRKIISVLFDKISNIKNVLNNSDLDNNSREYLTAEVKISYYANKLEELQSKSNPIVDQEQLEERLNIISSALDTLSSELNVNDNYGANDNIKSDEELSKMNDDNDDDQELPDDDDKHEEEHETSAKDPEIKSPDEYGKEDEYGKKDEDEDEDDTNEHEEDK